MYSKYIEERETIMGLTKKLLEAKEADLNIIYQEYIKYTGEDSNPTLQDLQEFEEFMQEAYYAQEIQNQEYFMQQEFF